MRLLPMQFKMGLIDLTLTRDILTGQYEVKLVQDGDLLHQDDHYDHNVAIAVFRGLQSRVIKSNGYIEIHEGVSST